MLPERLPVAGGTIFVFNVLLCPAGIVIGNETPVTENPSPAATTFEIVNVEALGLVIVSNWDIVAPTPTVPNATLVGNTVIVGWLVLPPVPLNATTTVGVTESFVIVMLPDKVPGVDGTILALNVLLAPAATSIGHDTPETEKPEPAAETFEIVNIAEPEFVTVIVCERVTPTPAVPKLTLTGETEIPGRPAPPPVPLNATTTLGVGELFVIVMVPDKLPVAGGNIFALNVAL